MSIAPIVDLKSDNESADRDRDRDRDKNRIIIVGGGVFGIATAIELKKRLIDKRKKVSVDEKVEENYSDVLLLDLFADSINSLGASSDLNRIVRADYASDLLFTQLALRSIEKWEEWNKKWKEEVFHRTGLLLLCDEEMKPGDYEWESYSTLSSFLPSSSLKRINSSECQVKFGPLLSGWVDGYFNESAGWVDNGRAMELMREEAIKEGVIIKSGVDYRVKSLLRSTDGCCRGVVSAGAGVLSASLVILSVGAWLPSFLPSIENQVRASAQPCLYVTPSVSSPFPLEFYSSSSYPVMAHNLSKLGWYSFPLSSRPLPSDPLGRRVIKIANHCTGLNRQLYPSPEKRPSFNSTIQERFDSFMETKLPWLFGSNSIIVDNKVCYYADTIDGDWLIDWEGGQAKNSLVIIGGDSGHAFKFLPVLGELICKILFGPEKETNLPLGKEEELREAKHRFRWKGTSSSYDSIDSQLSFDHCRALGQFDEGR